MDYERVLSSEAIDLLKYAISMRLQPGEDIDDVLSLVTDVAAARARARREAEPEAFDVLIAAALLCWWPLKPDIPDEFREQTVEYRMHLLELQRTQGRGSLAAELPKEVLEASLDEIFGQY